MAAPRLRSPAAHDFLSKIIRPGFINSKPNLEPYLRALSIAQVFTAEALVVEDSPRGLAAAKAAGLKCLIVKSDFTRGLNFEGADLVFDSLDKLGLAIDEL